MNTGQIIERIKGVVMLKRDVYRTIAEDPAATMEAWIVFVVATVISSLPSFFTYSNPSLPSSGSINTAARFTFLGGIGSIVVNVIIGAIAMYVAAWVLAWVAVRMGGKTNTTEMLRIVGYTRVFSVIGILGLLTFVSMALACLTGIISLVAAVLGLIGFVIGVREAAEFSTSNAVIASIIAAVIQFILYALIGGAITTAILAVS